jgi:hypothetical protein
VKTMKNKKYVTNVIEVNDEIKIVEFCEVQDETVKTEKKKRRTSLNYFVG